MYKNFITSSIRNSFELLVFVSLLLTLAVLIISAYIRLTNAGLGCTSWPSCYGNSVLPRPTGATSELLAVVPITWTAVLHRLFATLLGCGVLAITYMALRRRGQAGPEAVVCLMLVGLTLFLSVLGFVTPSSPYPAVTLGNLLGGMAILSILWWLGYRSMAEAGVRHASDYRVRSWGFMGLLVIIFQIGLGAWTSANLAATSCATFPDCHGIWWPFAGMLDGFNPVRQLAQGPGNIVVLDEGMRAIHMTHRYGALVALFYLGWLGIKAINLGGPLRAAGCAILFLLVLQVGLGITSVVLELPLLMVTAHNAVAALLLLSLVHLNCLLGSPVHVKTDFTSTT